MSCPPRRAPAFAVLLASLLLGAAIGAPPLSGQDRPRARDLGVPFPGEPGPLNAITDVAGVLVGHTTIIRGEGPLVEGEGPVRTGVTAVMPRGRGFGPVFAGWYSLNGNGEMTGTTWVEESGFLESPVMITNTHSVGVVHDAVIEWARDTRATDPLSPGVWWSLPVVAETWDGWLNDINGFHVTREDAFHAIEVASSGPVAEGNVGGGTGMVCNSFKGGIGTSSRRVEGYTVGVLVQCNYGRRPDLLVAGVPVGRELLDWEPEGPGGGGGEGASPVEPEDHGSQDHGSQDHGSQDDGSRDHGSMVPMRSSSAAPPEDVGSIIVVVATDAPLLPHQLKRLARRVPVGIGRMGGYGSNSSGDIFIAFSTANPQAWSRDETVSVEMLPNDGISPFLLATAQATEEAITNALVAAQTMVGRDDHVIYALPHDELRRILAAHDRLTR